MEDYHTAEQRETPQGEPVGCFGIYDGHGGRTCVRYVRSKLMSAVLHHESFARSDVPAALQAAFLQVRRSCATRAYSAASNQQQLPDRGAARAALSLGARRCSICALSWSVWALCNLVSQELRDHDVCS